MGRAVTRAAAPALAATVLWVLGRTRGAAVVAVLAAAVLVLGLTAPAIAAGLDRILHRAGEVVAHAVAVALSALAWVLVVLPVWALSRVVGYSPLDPGWSTPESSWTTVGTDRVRRPDGQPADPSRMGSLDPERSVRARRRSHLRLLVLAPLAVALLALAAPPLLRRYHLIGQDSTSIDLRQGASGTAAGASATPGAPGAAPATVPPDTPTPRTFNGAPVDDYAHEGEPWSKEHLREVSVAKVHSDYFLGFRLGDFESPYLNVRDGRRVTSTPAGADLTVWFLGGSTMFGIGQRDDHTIPSVVARLAEQDGIRIKALNFGVSGYVNWQETVLLAQQLTVLPKPDMVVFYDGVNDRGLGTYRVDDGSLDPSVMERLPLSDEERATHRASLGVAADVSDADRNELEVTLASAQYRRGVETARALARSYGFPVLHVWQPQPFAKKPNPADDELYRRLDFDPSILPASTATYDAIRTRSGVDPIDLTTALDDVTVPVFFDSSHTNELGARVVATELYRRIKPDLAAAARRP